MTEPMTLSARVERALHKLTRWRSVFAGWQLGTRSMEDAESNAVRDHREATILMRAELSALVQTLVAAGVIKLADYLTELEKEAARLDADYERLFPGFKATEQGINMTMPEAATTMQRLRFKP